MPGGRSSTSAGAALRARRTNMDVPISLSHHPDPAISLVETFRGGAHAYFDSSSRCCSSC